jgi:hypothetical protein
MSARGDVAKMGMEDPRLKSHRGTGVSGQRGGWVLDESRFRREGPDWASGGRGRELSALAFLAAGLAVVSIPLLWWPWRVWLRGFLALAAVALIALGLAALFAISESVVGLRGRPFAIAGIVVGVALLARIPFIPTSEERLLSYVRASIHLTCRPYLDYGWFLPRTPGELAAVSCEADGLLFLSFQLFESEETMYEAYNDRPSYYEGRPVGTDCGSPLRFRYAGPRAMAEQEYAVDGEERGKLFCGESSVTWTDNQYMVLGEAQGGDLPSLYQWWQDLQAGRLR